MDSDSSRRTEVAIQSGLWLEAITDIEQLCECVVTKVLREQAPDLAEKAEVSVLLTDDEAIRELNRRWRGKDRATNVLSFPALREDACAAGEDAAPPQLGDVALSFETLTREARESGVSLTDHLTHLLVHGTLHLLGLDHVEAVDAEAMERREIEILAGLGVADPYRGELAA